MTPNGNLPNRGILSLSAPYLVTLFFAVLGGLACSLLAPVTAAGNRRAYVAIFGTVGMVAILAYQLLPQIAVYGLCRSFGKAGRLSPVIRLILLNVPVAAVACWMLVGTYIQYRPKHMFEEYVTKPMPPSMHGLQVGGHHLAGNPIWVFRFGMETAEFHRWMETAEFAPRQGVDFAWFRESLQQNAAMDIPLSDGWEVFGIRKPCDKYVFRNTNSSEVVCIVYYSAPDED